MFLRICGSFQSAKNNKGLQIENQQIKRINNPQLTNPQIATFSEGPQI